MTGGRRTVLGSVEEFCVSRPETLKFATSAAIDRKTSGGSCCVSQLLNLDLAKVQDPE